MADPTEFDGKLVAIAGAVLTAAQWNAVMAGVQDEIEERLEMMTPCGLNGTISGFTCSISGTNIAIAAGTAYCEGKRYSGAGTVAFAALGANTYYVYIDPTDDTTPYKAKTTVPTNGELCLCKVTWSGAALSALLTDYQQWGVVAWKHSHFCAGSINSTNYPTTTMKDYIIVDRDIWLQGVQITMRTPPSASAIIVDVHVGSDATSPATIFTTTSYRPQFLTSYSKHDVIENTGYVMTNRKMTQGQVIEIWIDQVDSGNVGADLTILLYGRYY